MFGAVTALLMLAFFFAFSCFSSSSSFVFRSKECKVNDPYIKIGEKYRKQSLGQAIYFRYTRLRSASQFCTDPDSCRFAAQDYQSVQVCHNPQCFSCSHHLK